MLNRRARTSVLGLATAALVALAAPAGAATITEFPIEANAPAGKHRPLYITPAPDGTLWFTDIGTDAAVRHINTSGASLGAPINADASHRPTGDLGFDPSGKLHWAENSTNQAGYGIRATNGTVTHLSKTNEDSAYAVGFTAAGVFILTVHHVVGDKFGTCDPIDCGGLFSSRLTDLTLDFRGSLWALQPEGDAAHRITAAPGFVQEKIDLPAGSRPVRAASAPDGNLWIAAYGDKPDATNTKNQIIRMTPAGVQKSFQLPPGRGPGDITLGDDGALWFTEQISKSVGRLTTSGEYSSCPIPSGAQPLGITTGSDGAIWFTEIEAGRTARLTGNCVPVALPPDTTKPLLGSLKFSRTTFQAAKSGAAISAKKKRKAKVGTKVSFTLSEPSSVRFTVQRKAKGRKTGKKCVKPKRSNRRKRSCTRWPGVRGSFTVKGATGKNSFTFRGRIGGKRLKAGSYRLSGQATDGAKNASVVRRKGFKIVR